MDKGVSYNPELGRKLMMSCFGLDFTQKSIRYWINVIFNVFLTFYTKLDIVMLFHPSKSFSKSPLSISIGV